ncbi:hypothetical protein PR003_g30634, partial [Phytophthora rubi]
SRGGLIDTKALVAGLKSGKIGSVGLDVFEGEGEYFYSDRSGAVIGDETLARLFTFPNVLITGHQAFFTKEALDNIALTTFANVKAYVAKETLVNEVNEGHQLKQLLFEHLLFEHLCELARPPTIPFLNLQLEGIPATHVPLDVIKENLHGTGSPNRSESESARGSGEEGPCERHYPDNSL